MLSDESNEKLQFTTENLNEYLNALAKEYRKQGGKAMPAEIILVGGAAILANYHFREGTTDIDAIIHSSSAMKTAINRVGDSFGLPNGWLNTDFLHTTSYTPKLVEHSTYYRTFSHVLTVRIITAEYLIAMKLRSSRSYKHDLSDVIGILDEHKTRGDIITFERVDTAVQNLYGGWDGFPKDAKALIQGLLEASDYKAAFAEMVQNEQELKSILLDFEHNNPNVVNTDNVNDIMDDLAKSSGRLSVLEKLKAAKEQISSSDTADRPRQDPQL